MPFRYLLLGLLLLLPTLNTAIAADALQVLPTRVVLEKARSAELMLVNKGTEVGEYRISLRNMRTSETGTFSKAEEAMPGELFADNMVRFSPRSVTVQPGSFQKVRVMVRKPRELADGEYRTHMVFQSLPKQGTSVLDDSDEIDIQVASIVEITIPIIIRHGKLTSTVTIENPVASADSIAMDITRAGNRSLYGDVAIYQMNGGKRGDQVTFLRGMSIYVPNALRKVTLPLSAPLKSSQPYEIHFIEDEAYGGDSEAKLTFTP